MKKIYIRFIWFVIDTDIFAANMQKVEAVQVGVYFCVSRV